MNKNCNKPKCGPAKCRDDGFVFRKVLIPAALGDDVTGQDKPANGAMTNAFVTYEANGNQYLYDSYGVYTKFNSGDVLSVNGKTGKVVLKTSDLENDSGYVNATFVIETANAAVSEEANLRITADNGLQSQIDALAAASDVTDIVGTYAELEAYDTSKLKDNDIIKVLQDETHDDETTYYRWIKASSTFSLIGEEGPYYTKAAADQKFQDKLTAGSNITIDADNVISSSAAAQTIFYANSQETGATRHIYKDATFTQAASAQDLLDANEEGPIVLRITTNPNPDGLFSDAYIQNTYVGTGDYQFLFLDERTYREYAASTPSDTTFYYFSNTIQSQLTAGDNITINNNTISSKATKRYYFDSTSATPVYADSAETTAVTGQALYDAFQNNLVTFKDLSEQGIGWEPEYILEVATDTGAGMRLFVWGYYGSFMIEYSDKTATAATVTPGQSGPTVVQTTGTSQTDVMSQKATSNMIYPSGSETSKDKIIIPVGSATFSAISIGPTSTWTDSVIIGPGAKSNYDGYGTSIGHSSYAYTGSVAAGWSAGASNSSVALGYEAKANNSYAASIGRGSTSSRNYEVSVGNSSTTRYIANVKDPSLAHDAATKNYTDNLTISYAAINNAGAPTTATEAKYIGQLYYDTTNSDLYYCSAITPQGTTPETYAYTWTTVGGGPTVVQTTGTSQTDVMSQVAASQMIYRSGYETSKTRVQIGNGANTQNDFGICIGTSSSQARDYGVAIGCGAYAHGNNSVAIGRTVQVRATDANSIAIGFDSHTSRSNEFSIGGAEGTGPATRYLANVTDPQLAQDAATKNYVDTNAVGTTESYTIADTDWTALSASSPYTYSVDVTATYTIGANTIVELLNDQAVNFATYGFAIGAINGQTVTIYSIGAPSSSVTLKVNYKG